MQLNRPEAYETAIKLELMQRLLPLDDRLILELGCGGAWTTRQLAQRHPGTRFIATEGDERKHATNQQLELPNVEFRLEGAEAISQPDGRIDVIWMLKSLHYVPVLEGVTHKSDNQHMHYY